MKNLKTNEISPEIFKTCIKLMSSVLSQGQSLAIQKSVTKPPVNKHLALNA